VNWYLYRLLPPRPNFAATMSDQEQNAMGQHVAYWQGHLAAGRTLIFSPVADPAGDWGLAIVRADSLEDVAALGHADPAVLAGVARFDVLPLPAPIASA